MGDVGRPFRPIAPRTMPPGGGPDDNQPPGGGGPGDDGRVRRASTACKLCQKRRTKCSGAPAPCAECVTHQRECVFDQDADRRRKTSAKRTQDDLTNVRGFLENMLDVFRHGDDENIQLIITLIRAGASREEIQAMVRELSGNTSHASPRNPAPDDAPGNAANNHMSNFLDPR